jgi:hypothetical protein
MHMSSFKNLSTGLVVATIAAAALAGVVLLPSPAVAQGRPTYLICEADPGGIQIKPIFVKWEYGGLRDAVNACLEQGGHPAGVE